MKADPDRKGQPSLLRKGLTALAQTVRAAARDMRTSCRRIALPSTIEGTSESEIERWITSAELRRPD